MGTEHLEEYASFKLRLMMEENDLDYAGLISRLEAIGVIETYKSLNSKVKRGKFSFTFYVQCMQAMGCTELSISDLPYFDPTKNLVQNMSRIAAGQSKE